MPLKSKKIFVVCCDASQEQNGKVMSEYHDGKAAEFGKITQNIGHYVVQSHS